MAEAKEKSIKVMCNTQGADGAGMELADFKVEQSFIWWVRGIMDQIAAEKAKGSTIYCHEYHCWSVQYGSDAQGPFSLSDAFVDGLAEGGWIVVPDSMYIGATQPAEVPTVKISDSSCVFEAHPKHADTYQAVNTVAITRADLDRWEGVLSAIEEGTDEPEKED